VRTAESQARNGAAPPKLRPTAITLDVFLPDMLGWTVLSHLKRNPETRHILVQILAIEEEHPYGLEARRGALSFISKPLTTDGEAEERELRKKPQSVVAKGCFPTERLITARSGEEAEEALERLMQAEYAVVLLDVTMPGMDGFETDAVDYVLIPVELAEAHSNLQAEKTSELEQLNASLRQAVAGLKQADRRKDEFLAMLAHELRNPLAPIHNAIRLMRLKPMADSQLEWARDVIDRQSTHLTRLVDDLLDVSRITRRTINIEAKPLEISAAIARAIETVQPMLRQLKHELRIDLPPTPLLVLGDLLRGR